MTPTSYMDRVVRTFVVRHPVRTTDMETPDMDTEIPTAISSMVMLGVPGPAGTAATAGTVDPCSYGIGVLRH